ncbi:hypothetical protein PHJA_001402300 [Phtheirospermum japonicum]|uniref:Uncharacterized protein n=1 Tax=Phtheirospermum japonicum TaxID=374723 RepID=A0A830CE63_9LAMI|nr:hypothetical protein PHJA_001402300 [Phtheirospermum japonicum]
MGNCLFGGMGDGGAHGQSAIRVTRSNGSVMEFHTPITVESITDEFPSHGIFPSHDLFWKPLPHSHVLLAGESYYLLPLSNAVSSARVGHVRSSSAPPRQQSVGSAPAPYRMSFYSRRPAKRSPPAEEEEVRKGPACGFWKVKLVISPAQLLEILAEDGRTEELIESVRTVAKCGSGGLGSGFSDQWSLSSSRNAASSTNKDNSFLEF